MLVQSPALLAFVMFFWPPPSIPDGVIFFYVAGIVAMCGAYFAPVLTAIAGVTAFLGLVLGFFGFASRKRKRGVAGLIVSIIALVNCLIGTTLYFFSFRNSSILL